MLSEEVDAVDLMMVVQWIGGLQRFFRGDGGRAVSIDVTALKQ